MNLKKKLAHFLLKIQKLVLLEKKNQKASALMMLSRTFIQAPSLTPPSSLTEWGDRSQPTTIIPAAREDVYGVVIGANLGHSFCTGSAAIGGRTIAQRISVRTVTIIGGVPFPILALTAFFIKPSETLQIQLLHVKPSMFQC